MDEFRDKVAVITGAASGIGRALAERCAQEGMKVVLADVQEDALALADRDVKAMGVSTLAVRTDVSKASDVESLANRTLDTFGAVHLLCNNAGVVTSSSTVWESTLLDWQWILGVNLWGVIHGLHYFVPIMIEENTNCHIVNTASLAGIITSLTSPYTVTKHGIVAVSEILYRQLKEGNYNIGVSVLCPGFIKTNIMDSARNRPAELQNTPEEDKIILENTQASRQEFTQWIADGMQPSEVADQVFNAIKESKFYIFSNAEPFKAFIQARMEDILQRRNPTDVTPYFY